MVGMTDSWDELKKKMDMAKLHWVRTAKPSRLKIDTAEEAVFCMDMLSEHRHMWTYESSPALLQIALPNEHLILEYTRE